jgi:WD40 repeat protein
MWIKTTVSVAELAGTSAEVVPGGVAALDGSGTLLAVEASGRRVLLIDIENRRHRAIAEFGVMPLAALALPAYGCLLAAASADGRIVLLDVYTSQTRHKIDMSTDSLSALSFSPDGKLLAVGDNDGHVVVYQVSSGDEVRRLDTEMKVRALALDTSGTLVIGDAAGRVSVHRSLCRPWNFSETAGQ